MRIWALSTLVAVALCAAPGTASASLPDTKSKRIVAGRSMAGVELGDRVAAAKRAWGAGRDCGQSTASDGTCSYSGRGGDPGAPPTASFAFRRGRIVSISIFASRENGSEVFKGRLARWQTKDGVRLGTGVRRLRHVYRGRLRDEGNHYAVYTRGKRAATFLGMSDMERGRVTSITLAKRVG